MRKERGGKAGKKAGRGPTIADVLAPSIKAGIHTCNYWAAKTIVELYGGIRPSDLGPTHVENINVKIDASRSPFTRCNRSAAVRRLLRKLYEDHGAARLAERISKARAPRPRNVTATEEERAKMMAAAPLHMRLWLLLCSDMAMRAGTAAKITPNQYDKKEKTVTFTTKYDSHQTLTVTEEIARIMGIEGLNGSEPYVRQLARMVPRGRYGKVGQDGEMGYNTLAMNFKKMREDLGITRKLTAHDLRRTTAVKVYKATKDLRQVQALLGHADLTSTLWYLDHHMTPVTVATLELAKLNPSTEVVQ